MHIERRKLLQLSRAAATAVLLAMATPKRISPERSSSSDFKVRFRPGGHTLMPADILGNTTIIAGETRLDDLRLWEKPEIQDKKIARYDFTLKDYMFPSTTTTPRDMALHIESLRKAKEQGAILTTTDLEESAGFFDVKHTERFYELYQRGDLYMLAGLFGSAAIGAGLTGLAISLLKHKDLIPTVLGPVGLTLGTLSALYYELIQNEESVSELIKQLTDLQIPMPFSEFHEVKKDMVTFFEGEDAHFFLENVNVRNSAMALNTHIVKQVITQMPDLKHSLTKNVESPEILFYAGLGHAYEYQAGPYKLEQQLSAYAGSLIDYCAKWISDGIRLSNQEEYLKRADDWILLSAHFGFPLGTHMKTSLDEYVHGPPRITSPSPRQVLWQQLISKISKSDLDSAKRVYGDMATHLWNQQVQFQWEGSQETQRSYLSIVRQRLKQPQALTTIIDLNKYFNLKGQLVFVDGAPLILY